MSFPALLFFLIPRPPISTLFPTRRSSDLRDSARSSRDVAIAGCPPTRHSLHRSRSDRSGNHSSASRGKRIGDRRHRSEEHTSELQSRRDLVCRLLLEKKKTLN